MPLAYAKINLGLFVLGNRVDGYHDIDTVFHRIALADEVRFEPSATIEVESSDPAAPGGETNICYKAAQLVQKALGLQRGIRITITKRIPVGAGLGGGSTDAALVLRQLPGIWDASLGDSATEELALRLGSDVPFFLRAGSAHATGRGEKLEYFPLDVPYAILLCCPAVHVSTAWAYSRLAVSPQTDRSDLKAAVIRGMADPSVLAREVRNDFEDCVFAAHPVIRRVKERLAGGGADFTLMSGSGASVYGLFSDIRAASETAAALERQGYRTHTTPPHFQPAA